MLQKEDEKVINSSAKCLKVVKMSLYFPLYSSSLRGNSATEEPPLKKPSQENVGAAVNNQAGSSGEMTSEVK